VDLGWLGDYGVVVISERPATALERRALTAHLLVDRNARAYGEMLGANQVRATWAPIASRRDLGDLSTGLAELGRDGGSRHAFELTGQPRFLVRDAYANWRDSTGDETKFALLEQYIAVAREGELTNLTLTLAPDSLGLRLIDGNKRAIALYEADRATRYPLRVFILRTP
jgi:hypothetical protein